MATTVERPAVSPRGRGQQKRGNLGRRTNNRGAQASAPAVAAPIPALSTELITRSTASLNIEAGSEAQSEGQEQREGEEDVCWICAETIKFYSIAECNHKTCHVCALRLRALYKNKECTFCKLPQPTVLFTSMPPDTFQSYDLDSMPNYDDRLSIRFESQEMMEESLLLLRFNCPDPDCDFIGSGWADLKWHIRDKHGKLMCDLCIRNKKIFAHEHTIYAPNQLPLHLPSMRRAPNSHGKQKEKEIDAHPMCEFCRECFYGEDELFSHLREKHEECFVCKKQGAPYQYFLNWGKLDEHFQRDHFQCMMPSCLEQKFIVFPTQMDLSAHMVEEHGSSMTAKDMKGARKVNVPFAFAHEEGHRAARARPGGGATSGPPDPPAPSGAGARIGSRRANFGAQLTTNDTAGSQNVISSGQFSLGRADADPATQQRQREFNDYLQSVTPSINGLTAVRSAIRSWQSSESTSFDMVDTMYNVYERNSDKTLKVLSMLLNLFEGERRSEIEEAMDGIKTKHIGQTASAGPSTALRPGQRDYAGISSGRVINAKRTTRGRTPAARVPIWERVERVASSSSAQAPARVGPAGRVVPGATGPAPSASTQSAANFPSLPGTAPKPAATVWRGPTASVPSAARVAQTPIIRSVHVQPKALAKPSSAPKLPRNAFPELPKDNSATDTWGTIAGPSSTAPANNAWGPTPKASSRSTPRSNGAANNRQAQAVSGANTPTPSGGKKKKGKETLFTLGGTIG